MISELLHFVGLCVCIFGCVITAYGAYMPDGKIDLFLKGCLLVGLGYRIMELTAPPGWVYAK